MEQLILHLVGDYLLQTDQMAKNKGHSWKWATLHALVYSLPFWLLRPSLAAWLVIFGTHLLVDRLRLARYLIWLKTRVWLGQEQPNINPRTGMAEDLPEWLAFILWVVTDNTMHLAINFLALTYL